jgi:hypothetical protein
MLSETDYLVWIGPFTDYSSALYAEQQAKKMGYLEAQNTSFEYNSPANNTFTTPNEQLVVEPTPPSNQNNTNSPVFTPPSNQGNSNSAVFTPPSNRGNSSSIVFIPPVPVTPSPVVRAEIVQTTPPQNTAKMPAFAIAPSFEEKVNPSLTNLQENTNKAIPAAPWDKPNMPVSVPATPPAFGVSPELDEKDQSIYAPIYNEPSEIYNSIANNPRIQNRIDRLEKKKKRHDNKANKIDAKIRDIEQDAVMKSVYGKTKK